MSTPTKPRQHSDPDAVELVSLVESGSRFEVLKPALVGIFDKDFMEFLEYEDLCQSVEPKLRMLMIIFSRTVLDCHMKITFGYDFGCDLAKMRFIKH
jgi:hypothetical protein